MAQVPSDLMRNCNQWKITYPDGSSDKTLCNEGNNEYFYASDSGDAIVFRTPVRSDNGTTPNSSYIRSELREMEADGSTEIYWTTDGTHTVYVKQAITHLPINKNHLVATQIHGDKSAGIDDAMVLRLEGSHLFLSFNGSVLRSNLTIKSNYVLGTVHEVIFEVIDGKHYCYYAEDGNLLSAYENDTASVYLVKDGSNDFVMDLDYDQSYFKIGNYTQSNAEKEGDDTDDTTNYGEVYVYDFFVDHAVGSVRGIELSPSTVDIAIGGNFQLTPNVNPSGAANKGVTYLSSDETVASVSEIGNITGIAPGTVYIIATTIEGGFKDSSVINVVGDPKGQNLALEKTVSGTGTHHEDNIVSNLVDGLTSTRWSVSGYPQTATIDLGEIYTVARTEMVCYTDRKYQYTVSISDTENGTYTQIVDRSKNTSPATVTNPNVDIFTGVEGRFIKIEVTGADEYTGTWVSLLEFRAYEGTKLSAKKIIATDEVTIWPNPADNTIYINDYYRFETVSIFNQEGSLVFQQPIRDKSLDVSHLNSGLYLLQLYGEDEFVIKRFIKK